jgi:hypothetical protein
MLLLFALALGLRLLYLDQIEHNVDEAYPIAQALLTIERGELPLLGQGTSVLFANPPLAGYLYVPLLAVVRSPLIVYLAVIALNSLGVVLSFYAIRVLFGTAAGLIGALLLAVNPWLIEYGRAAWVQGLLPFYLLALAALLWPLLLGNTKHAGWRWIGACLMFMLAAGSYLLAYALLVPIALWLVVYRRQMAAIPRHALVISALIVIVPTLLYIGALINSRATQDRLNTFVGGQFHVTAEAWDHAGRLLSGRDYPAARGVDAPVQDGPLRQTLTDATHILLVIALIAGVLLPGNHRWIPIIGFFAPIALMTITPQIVHPFYQLIGLPSGAALVGRGFVCGVELLPIPARRLAWSSVAVAGALFALLMGINSARFAEETAALPGAHGLSALPLGDGLRVGAAIRAALGENGAVYSPVDEWILMSFSGQAFDSFWHELDPNRLTILPATSGVYVHMADQPSPFVGTQPASRIDLADGTAVIVEAVAPNTPLPEALTPLRVTGTLEDRPAAALVGYALTETDDQAELLLAWEVLETGVHTAARLFAPFAHVFNEHGERIAIADGVAIPGYLWRTGDRHLHRLTFPRPAASYTISVGQYDAGAGINLLFDGSPLAELE